MGSITNAQILNNFNYGNFTKNISEEKDDVNQTVEAAPQKNPVPVVTNFPSNIPNTQEQLQPEVDEDGNQMKLIL